MELSDIIFKYLTMNKIFFLLIFFSHLFSYSQTKKDYKQFKTFYNSELKCVSIGTPGTSTVEVGIIQKNKKPNYEEAKKSAVFSIIFNGVIGNTSVGCDPQSSLLKEDDFEKNLKYFKTFFESGKYSQFISLSNDEFIKISKLKKGYKLRLRMVIRTRDLSEKLESDGIRKGLGNYF